MTRPADDKGVALLNVVAVVAVASAAVLLMVAGQEQQLTRSTTYREASQALAYARGGELSAIAALRRDMIEAPELDHDREAWAAAEDREVAIEGGRFTLDIADAQDRFNLNTLRNPSLLTSSTLDRVLEAARIDRAFAPRILLYVRENGPIAAPAELAAAGLDARALARLAPLVSALPPEADLNANAASAQVLGALLSNPVAGRLLVQRREATGYLTAADFERIGVILPPGIGLTSDHYRVTTEIQFGETRQRVVSLLRRRRLLGQPEVVVIRRVREPASPSPQ